MMKWIKKNEQENMKLEDFDRTTGDLTVSIN